VARTGINFLAYLEINLLICRKNYGNEKQNAKTSTIKPTTPPQAASVALDPNGKYFPC